MPQSSFTTELTDAEIVRIVTESMPHWRAACDNPGADTVILQQGAFKNSPDELLLMGIAIKYAGIVKKNVTICL